MITSWKTTVPALISFHGGRLEIPSASSGQAYSFKAPPPPSAEVASSSSGQPFTSFKAPPPLCAPFKAPPPLCVLPRHHHHFVHRRHIAVTSTHPHLMNRPSPRADEVYLHERQAQSLRQHMQPKQPHQQLDRPQKHRRYYCQPRVSLQSLAPHHGIPRRL